MADTATVHPINKGANQPPSTTNNNQNGKGISKPKLTRVLPTNRIALDRQLLLLRAYAAAYAHFNEPLSIRQVSGVAKMDRTGISMANGLWVDTGLIEKAEAGFVPSAAVIAFNHAYEWNPETAAHKLAPVLQKTWFAQRLMPRIMLGALAEKDAIDELAAASAASPEHRSQLRMLLELLEKAGIVKRENESYVKGVTFRKTDTSEPREPEGGVPASAASAATPAAEPKETPKDVQIRSSVSTTFNQVQMGALQFAINVKVDMAEFAGWEPNRIKAFFAGIAQVLAAKAAVELDADN